MTIPNTTSLDPGTYDWVGFHPLTTKVLIPGQRVNSLGSLLTGGTRNAPMIRVGRVEGTCGSPVIAPRNTYHL